METSTPFGVPLADPPKLSRRDKLLRREVDACEDPVCCCEPEPRWLQFQNACEAPAQVTEWEALARPPSQEL